MIALLLGFAAVLTGAIAVLLAETERRDRLAQEERLAAIRRVGAAILTTPERR